jgi:hypothetical protein
MKAALCLLLLIGLIGIAHTQTRPQPEQLPKELPVGDDFTKIRIDDGNFVLLLPPDLRSENLVGPIHSYRAIPQFNLPEKAEDMGKDPCSHPLALFGTGGDADTETASRGSKKDKFVPIPPAGGISVVEIDDRCVAKMTNDDVLSRLANEAHQVDGLEPAARMISYAVDGTTIWLAIATGYSKNEHGKRTPKAGQTLVANISFKARGHYFVLGVIANDVQLFNRLMKSRVNFNEITSSRLVPFELSRDNGKNDAVPK